MNRPTTATLAAALMLAASPAAFAEIADDAPIVVTATPLDDAPEAVLQGVATLERGAIIANLGAGLGETLESQPGVSSSFFGAGASRPIIRGLGEDRIRVLTNGLGQIDASSVSPDHAVTAEGLEAERIEILRGAAALAYGGNAVGGIVNVLDGRILEAAPEAAISGAAFGSAATGIDATEGAAAATFATDRFALRIDGFIRDAGDFDVPGFAFSDALRAEETEEALEEGEEPPEFDDGFAPNSFSQSEGLGLGLSTFGDWGFAGVSVRRLESLYGLPEAGHKHAHDEEETPALAALSEEEEEAIFDGPRIDLESTRYEARFGLSRGFGPVTGLRAEAAYVDYSHVEIEETGEIATLFENEGYEARLEAAHELGPLRGVAGISATDLEFSALGEEAFVTPTDIQDIGLFVVERLPLSDTLAFDAGFRVERRTYDNLAFGEREFDLISGSVGAGWRPSDALFLGLTVARTERAPSEIELFADGAHLATQSFEIGDPTLGEEVATSIEATARWTAGRLALEANVFHIAFDDYTTFFATGDEDEESELPIFEAAQEDATFTGGELVARFGLIDAGDFRLTLDGAVDLVRAELDGGGNVPRIPPRTVTVGADAALGQFDGRLEWVNVADAEDLAAFETPTEGFDLINARLSFRPVADSDRLVVTLDGRNLTDEEARVHTSFVKDILPRPGRSLRLVLASRF